MQKIIKDKFYLILLLVISVTLFVTNYKSGTYLIGWDNLFPEFNFKQDIYRNFNAVWQQYRGLGLIDGMSHAANLIHDIERLFLSLFLPTSLIRWTYMFLMHLLGGVGLYYLLSKNLKLSKFTSFLGSLFYQFNLFTIQQFFLPFEVFVVHFAFLPWLFFWALEFLQKGDRKTLIYFFIFSLLAIPQSHVPTLFIVYLIGLTILFVTRLLLYRKPNDFKKIFLLIFITLAVNSFWGLPFTYQTLTNSKNIVNSKTFQMSTNDIFYRNKKYGSLLNLVYQKSFSLDFKYFDYKSGGANFMMLPWLNHLKSPFFIVSAWIFFTLSILGLIYSLKEKNKAYLPFTTLFVFSFIMLGTDIPIISWVTEFFRKNIPLFSTVFRFTFTKFSILYVFSCSILLAIGLNFLYIRLFHGRLKVVAQIVLLLFFIFYSLPAFRGNFFYENLAVKIPDQYFQVFKFFQKQKPDERVAILPIPWYWAWSQPKWGTINSGFIWYGIPQPITDLAFNPWGSQNENFYWEMDRAIFSKDSALLNKVLNKYDIGWVYFDENISNDPGKKFTHRDLKNVLSQVKNLKLATKIGKINIYKFKKGQNLNNFVGLKKVSSNISPTNSYDDFDQAYLDNGDYINSDKDPQIYYPFRSLFSGKNPEDIQFNVEEDDKYLYFNPKLKEQLANLTLKTPEVFKEEFSLFDENYKTSTYSADLLKDSQNKFIVRFEKNNLLEYSSLMDKNFLKQTNDGCEKNNLGIANMEIEDDAIRLTSLSSNNCVRVFLPNLSHRFGYLLNIKLKTDNKRGLYMSVYNNTIQKPDIETYTQNDGKPHNYFFVISPRSYYGQGYTLNFDNVSEGNEEVINTLQSVKVYKIPYYYLKNIKFVSKNLKKYDQILYLSQAFHDGWKAYEGSIFGKELTDHVLVNNWANGWRLRPAELGFGDPKGANIVIIFWPQYLEFLGFGLMGAALIFILKYRKM